MEPGQIEEHRGFYGSLLLPEYSALSAKCSTEALANSAQICSFMSTVAMDCYFRAFFFFFFFDNRNVVLLDRGTCLT